MINVCKSVQGQLYKPGCCDAVTDACVLGRQVPLTKVVLFSSGQEGTGGQAKGGTEHLGNSAEPEERASAAVQGGEDC